MSQNNLESNNTSRQDIRSSEAVPSKNKKNYFYLKFFIALLIILILLFFNNNLKTIPINSSKNNSSKFIDQVKDGEILDLDDEYKNQHETTINDLNIAEIKEKGAEFVYQLLIKNQVQIEDINNQIRQIKSDFLKLKNQEKFNKIVLNYINLREKLFLGEDCKSDIESFDLLTINDDFLVNKFSTIKQNYHNYITRETLLKNFDEISKILIVNENYNPDTADLLEKLRYNFRKLIIIRKTNVKDSSQLQSSIIIVENLLKSGKNSEALAKLLSLDKIYFPIIQRFLEELNSVIEIQNADQDIIKYLKSLN